MTVASVIGLDELKVLLHPHLSSDWYRTVGLEAWERPPRATSGVLESGPECRRGSPARSAPTEAEMPSYHSRTFRCRRRTPRCSAGHPDSRTKDHHRAGRTWSDRGSP